MHDLQVPDTNPAQGVAGRSSCSGRDSGAILGLMPLTDELGTLAVNLAGIDADPRVPASGFGDGTFETWLSRLAEDQPPEALGRIAADVVGCRTLCRVG